jgi:dATP/dGTP diphosphohydrolase
MIDTKKLEKFITARNAFSSKTFGTPEVRDCMGPLHHLKKEIVELIENPDDESEWADCLLLLLDAAWRKGHTLQDLFDFAEAKLKVNKKRKWKKGKNGVYQHI